MAIRRVKLIFPQDKIQSPVVFTMAKKFDVVPNIRRAQVTETIGEMTLELDAPEDKLKAAVQYLEQQGVKVTSLGEDVI